MFIREKTPADLPACLAMLRRVHRVDSYPLCLPDDLAVFLTPPYEIKAWVAERDSRLLGHVALHSSSGDPTLEAAQRATGLSTARLAVLARLFVDPRAQGGGVGRALLRTASTFAREAGQRAVLDVGQTSARPIALYESEGWTRTEALSLVFKGTTEADLWVYVSPLP